MPTNPLWRRLVAEFTGTAGLLIAVVGSGIMATRLSPGDVGLQLLESSIAIILALDALILAFGPISGAHFNPVVSLADWFLGRRAGTGLTPGDMFWYVVAQVLGAIAGTIMANLMYALPAVTWAEQRRDGTHLWLSEIVATAGLIFLIFALARSGRAAWSAATVSAYIGAACWSTASASFVNPAITVARAFSDTFAGIAPTSVPGFVIAQLVGGAVGVGLLLVLYPHVAEAADRVVIPHEPDAAADSPHT